MIDVHCHLLPAGHAELAERYGTEWDGAPPGLERPEACWARVGEHGLAVVSPPPWLFRHDLEPPAAAAYAAALNDGMLAAVAGAGSRAAVLAWLPLQTVDATLEEIRRIARQDRVVGVEVGSHPGRRSLSDPALDRVWAALAAEQLALFVHPNVDALRAGPAGMRPQVLGWPVATTAALLELLASDSGLWSAGVRLCAAHGGGFVAAALARAARVGALGADDRLAQLWVDGVVFDDRWLAFLHDVLPDRHVLPGTDWPFGLSVSEEGLRAQCERPGADPLAAALAWCPRLALVR